MTNRILLDPNALPTLNEAEVRQVLVDLWSIASIFKVDVTADYYTTGQVAHEFVIGLNSGAITVYLHDGNNNTPVPEDGQRVTIKRTDGGITIDGGDFNIDDAGTNSYLSSVYHAITLMFDADDGQWHVLSTK